MARPSKAKEEIEAQRLTVLHQAQNQARRRLDREIRVKKAGYHLPGELTHKKNIAVFLKLAAPGISFTEIAKRIGETKTTVREWFKNDPDVKEFYQWSLDHLRQGALTYMETYGFEATETLVVLMRMGSEKTMLDAATNILDRIGVPKVSRTESTNENKQSHQWTDRDKLVEDLRQLSPEEQEEALSMIEGLEGLLSKKAKGDTDEEPDEVEEMDDDGS